MSDRKQSSLAHAEHYYEREVWMHEFRNALGTILAAAGAANSLLMDHREIEVSIAIGHIEDGCNRCLRLFRTMPPF